MVEIKKIFISLSLPIIGLIIIPYLLLILIDKQPLIPILNDNIFLLTIGFIVLLMGLILSIDCIILFFKIGKGTLMPASSMHTKKLVISGPYRYVRNPMILGVITTQIGEALIFNSISVFIYALVFLLLNILYMNFAEKKGLIERFGENYIHYKENVRGWIPHFKPYSQDSNNLNE